ncbi:MAG TPA: glycine oxidase ThiO [Rhizomicrobium sp.]|jgi:glycine oxidase
MKIVIIGAGIAGLSLGWRLAQSGAKVTVLERAQPGQGATIASAGLIAPTSENDDEDNALSRFSRASAALWPAFAAEVEEVSRHRIGFHAEGTLLIAKSDADAQRLANRAKGVSGARLLNTAEARAMEPMLDEGIAGALFDPDEAQVDNRAVGLALARAFIRAGGSLQANEAVVRLEVEKGKVLGAVTPFGVHRADAYVLAAGAWTGRIDGMPAEIVPPIVPVKGEMIALAPNAGGVVPGHVIWGNGVYLVPRHGQIFVGATSSRSGFDTSLTDEAANWLRSGAEGLMPLLAGWSQAEHWAGLRPGTPDDLPIVGETAVEGIYVAGGQFRNGILLAPAMAEALRSLILERRASIDISAFDSRRFTKPLVAEADVVR